jgi:hypothetical protein
MSVLQSKLSEGDKQQRAWLVVVEHLHERIDQLRKDNDLIDNDLVRTAYIRGKIAALKEMLQEPQPLISPDFDYRD